MTRQKTTEFLQVDVEVRSRKPLPALAALVTNHREVSEMHIGRIGGLHCVHFNLLLRPTTIAKTIAKLATIVARFPPAARREWKTAVRRDFNVGIHAGIGPGCTEYPIDAPSLAAMASCLVYEPRRDEQNMGERGLPRGAFRIAYDATTRLWAELDDLEHDYSLPRTEPLAPGLAAAMHAWARGGSLDRVLIDADMAAGDFVRWAKQTIDLLDQLSIVAEDGDLARTARRALDGVRRGIVVYTAV